MLIAVTGYPGAGKTVFSDLLEEELDNVANVETGELIRETYEEETGNHNASSKEVGDWVTKKLNEDQEYFAKVFKRKTRNINNNHVIFGGLRKPLEYDIIRKGHEKSIIIHVDASTKTRFRRIKNRGRKDESDFTIDDLKEKDKQQSSWGLNEMVERSEITVKNEGNLSDLRDEAKRVKEKIEEI